MRRGPLAGFFLSGFLLALPGPLLPLWGYHIASDYAHAGAYFVSLSAGIIGGWAMAQRLFRGSRLSTCLTFTCTLAAVALLYLELVPPPAAAALRMIGLMVVGLATGMFHAPLFAAVRPLYERDHAATLNLGGIFFGLGCLAPAAAAGAYHSPSVLILLALIPLSFGIVYSRSSLHSDVTAAGEPPLKKALRDFRSPAAALFALLLLVQFGNEWSIGGWLPLYLIWRVGMSPKSSVMLLGLYWLVLAISRGMAYHYLSGIPRGRLLFASAGAAVFGCMILLLTNNPLGATMGILLMGWGFAPIYPLVAERIGGRFPYYHPGLFNAIFSFSLAGGMLAPGLVGLLARPLGIWVVMGLPLLGTCVVVVLLLLIWLGHKVTGT